MSRLQEKFKEFQQTHNIIMIFLVSYIADYQDIFELLLDYYEEKYLLRFAEPRHGNTENALDINEFWKYIKTMESIQKRAFILGGFVPQSYESLKTNAPTFNERY